MRPSLTLIIAVENRKDFDFERVVSKIKQLSCKISLSELIIVGDKSLDIDNINLNLALTKVNSSAKNIQILWRIGILSSTSNFSLLLDSHTLINSDIGSIVSENINKLCNYGITIFSRIDKLELNLLSNLLKYSIKAALRRFHKVEPALLMPRAIMINRFLVDIAEELNIGPELFNVAPIATSESNLIYINYKNRRKYNLLYDITRGLKILFGFGVGPWRILTFISILALSISSFFIFYFFYVLIFIENIADGWISLFLPISIFGFILSFSGFIYAQRGIIDYEKISFVFYRRIALEQISFHLNLPK